MRVTVEAFGELRRYLLGGAPVRTVELPEGATLADLACALDADPDDLPLARRSRRRSDSRAGDMLREESALCDGDRIELFAPVGGG
ncbi:MAG: MoaD/ThiS family protein [Ktedonobacterales bacterium]